MITRTLFKFCVAKQRIKVLEKSSSYSRRGVVWCVTAKEAEQMRKILEDFYYGNITPCEKIMRPGSTLQRAVNTAAQCENQLTEMLDEVGRGLLTRLVKAQH